jgi:hypothetical protein
MQQEWRVEKKINVKGIKSERPRSRFQITSGINIGEVEETPKKRKKVQGGKLSIGGGKHITVHER